MTDLTKKVLKIMSNVLPPNHSEELVFASFRCVSGLQDWPKWTIPFGWALNSAGQIRSQAPEFYYWRDLCVGLLNLLEMH